MMENAGRNLTHLAMTRFLDGNRRGKNVVGYSLSGAPCGVVAELINWANKQDAPTLSVDTPSKLDATSGQAHEPTIRAAATLTLALPKVGLLQWIMSVSCI